MALGSLKVKKHLSLRVKKKKVGKRTQLLSLKASILNQNWIGLVCHRNFQWTPCIFWILHVTDNPSLYFTGNPFCILLVTQFACYRQLNLHFAGKSLCNLQTAPVDILHATIFCILQVTY